MYPPGGGVPSGREEERTALVSNGSHSQKGGREDADPVPVPVADGPKLPTLSYFRLFRYANSWDVVLMMAGSIGAICNGAMQPLSALLIGDLLNTIGGHADDGQFLVDEASLYAVWFFLFGLAAFGFSYLELTCWIQAGERQAVRLRENLLQAVLRQEVGFFDTECSTGEVVNRLSNDTVAVQEAISEKCGNFLHHFSCFVSGFVIGFIRLPDLTLVILSVTPLLAISEGVFFTWAVTNFSRKGEEQYKQASTIVENNVSSIRTVFSLVAEARAQRDYSAALASTFRPGLWASLSKGFGVGLSYMVLFGAWALGLWYGSVLILTKDARGGDVVAVFFAVIFGGMALGTATTNLPAFTAGRIAGAKVFQLIDRRPRINKEDPTGAIPRKVEGRIELKNVDFTYPARPDAPIFQNFSLLIPPGEVVALVGSSGSGKSTIIQLLERFYDPQAGQVLLDGRNLRDLNLGWLRAQVGLVSQEPALFAMTVKDNILYGNPDASDEQVEEAARVANALGFISKLPDGFDTQVGERGVSLSGGQKQRIAIARAVLKDPRILLLDEATSALDTESERVVQAALDRIMVGKTTVVVAHRLSTVRNADSIAVVQEGRIIEQGSHDQLLLNNGAYAALVQLQGGDIEQEEGGGVALEDMLAVADAVPIEGVTRGRGEEESPRTRMLGKLPSLKELKRTIERRLSGKDRERLSIKGIEMTDPVHGGEVKDLETEGNVPLSRLLGLSRPEMGWGVLGVVGAAVGGAVHPLFAYVMAEIIRVYFDEDRGSMKRNVEFWTFVFIGIGVTALLSSVTQFFFFGIMGERLTQRVREMTFAAVLRQEVGWFDREENASSRIAARLATDATLVRGLVGDRLSLVVQNTVMLGVGMGLAFVINWQMTLVVAAIFPLLVASAYLQWMFLEEFARDIKGQYERASQVAGEAVSSIRIVASSCAEQHVVNLYGAQLKDPLKVAAKRGQVSGLGLGLAMLMLFSAEGLSFWCGSLLIRNGSTSFGEVIKVFLILIVSAMSVSEASSLMPDVAKGHSAVQSIFKVVDRQTEIDSDDPMARELPDVQGAIELQNVRFAYPSRPDVMVFQNFSLRIPPRKVTALVGPSGHGKSTVIGLVERFYDPLRGTVLIDGADIRGLRLRWLRQRMGLVGQEPVLFKGSIRDNIAYGKEGAAEAEIEQAARLANAHSFICAMPSGYSTQVGERGAQLSGGQKQRIAIARAMLKDPAVLLLDEATSALDAESEKAIQEALSRFMQSRTTVIVAHRLSTIRAANLIAVVQNGAVVEQGTHAQLVAKPGSAYGSLIRLQYGGSASSSRPNSPPQHTS